MIPMGNIIAQRLHEIVQDGELGLDYSFDQERSKNKDFRRKYNIDDTKMKEIFLQINGSHYVKSEQSTNVDHTDDTVHVFKTNTCLMPRFDENADYVTVCIYIKLTWPNGEEPMFIISFHEDDE